MVLSKGSIPWPIWPSYTGAPVEIKLTTVAWESKIIIMHHTNDRGKDRERERERERGRGGVGERLLSCIQFTHIHTHVL